MEKSLSEDERDDIQNIISGLNNISGELRETEVFKSLMNDLNHLLEK